jgi:hypothetical protein
VGGVSRQHRHDWKERFLEVPEESAMVATAARVAGINRQYAYEVKGQDAEFSARWDEIREAALDEVEKAGFEKAKDGDSHLIKFLLTTCRGQVYRETQHVEHSGTVSLTELAASE